MKRNFFLAALVFLALYTNAQILKKINAFVKDSKIDTFLVYSFDCYHDPEFKASDYKPGNPKSPGDKIVTPIQLIDTCSFKDPKFVFWNTSGNSFMKRFERCKNFKAVELNIDNPLTLYLRNKDIINKEEIKLFIHVDHKCSYSFAFYNKGDVVCHSTTNYAFVRSIGESTNSYYEFNMSSKFKALIDKVGLFLRE